MPKSVMGLGRSLKEWADKHGVDTAVCVIRHPDSSDVVTFKRGDRVWQMGAVAGVYQELIDNWVTIDEKED